MIVSIILLLVNIYTLLFIIADIQAVRMQFIATKRGSFLYFLLSTKRMEIDGVILKKLLDQTILEQKLTRKRLLILLHEILNKFFRRSF